MELASVFSFFLHIDVHLAEITSAYGAMTYLILFAIVFLETGVVVTPFLPGDSLLFAAGAIASLGTLNVLFLALTLFVAAVLGDSVNYFIGKNYGRRVAEFAHRKSFMINYEHIRRTEEFYSKHGGKAIVLARFIPIVRTFAPFVAGLSLMDYRRFFMYNVLGGFVWVALFVFAGFFFGNVPIVKDNFSLVIIIIIILSIMPIVAEIVKGRKRN